MKSPLFSLLIPVAVAVACASCGGGHAGTAGDGGVTIDVAADYPAEEVGLQTVADVEYVPLAISDEVLLSSSDRIFYLSDSHIMIMQRRSGGIFVFDRAGGIISHFNRTGRGSGEYVQIRDIVFDPEAVEFFVVDAVDSKVEVYSLAGEHERTLQLPEGWQIRAYNFDESSLLAYDESQLLTDNFNTTPYALISKADGSVIETLDIKMPVRYTTRKVRQTPGEGGQMLFQPLELGLVNNRFGAEDLTLADISSDTVYHFTHERVLTPAFVRTPSVHASEPRVVWSAELVSESFIVFTVLTLDFESAWTGKYPPVRSLMYNRITGRIVEPRFVDENNPSGNWSGGSNEAAVTAGTAVSTLDPLKLKEAQEKGKLGGTLAEIAARIKEDDNPVVVIIKFK